MSLKKTIKLLYKAFGHRSKIFHSSISFIWSNPRLPLPCSFSPSRLPVPGLVLISPAGIENWGHSPSEFIVFGKVLSDVVSHSGGLEHMVDYEFHIQRLNQLVLDLFVRCDKLLKYLILRKHLRYALFAAQQIDGARVTSGWLASNSKIFKLRRELTCIVVDGACKLWWRLSGHNRPRQHRRSLMIYPRSNSRPHH